MLCPLLKSWSLRGRRSIYLSWHGPSADWCRLGRNGEGGEMQKAEGSIPAGSVQIEGISQGERHLLSLGLSSELGAMSPLLAGKAHCPSLGPRLAVI